MMQAKVVHNNVPNSPDSSEESSGGSPNHFTGGNDGPNTDAEESLPSVVSLYCSYIFVESCLILVRILRMSSI